MARREIDLSRQKRRGILPGPRGRFMPNWGQLIGATEDMSPEQAEMTGIDIKRMTPEEALKVYTISSAYSAFVEGRPERSSPTSGRTSRQWISIHSTLRKPNR